MLRMSSLTDGQFLEHSYSSTLYSIQLKIPLNSPLPKRISLIVSSYITGSPPSQILVLKQNFSVRSASLLWARLKFSLNLLMGMQKQRELFSWRTRVMRWMRRLQAEFSSAVSCTSMVLNYTRQPISASMGILSLTEFQLVPLSIQNRMNSSLLISLNFLCTIRKSRLKMFAIWKAILSSISTPSDSAICFTLTTSSYFTPTQKSLYYGRFFGLSQRQQLAQLYLEVGRQSGWFQSRSWGVLSSTLSEIIFHLTSQSDTFPLQNGVPAVSASRMGLMALSWSQTYRAWSKHLVEKVHCRQQFPIPNAMASIWMQRGSGQVRLSSAGVVFLSWNTGTLICTVYPLLILTCRVRVRKRGWLAMWLSSIYLLCVIWLLKGAWGSLIPRKGMTGMVRAIRDLVASALYFSRMEQMISQKLQLVLQGWSGIISNIHEPYSNINGKRRSLYSSEMSSLQSYSSPFQFAFRKCPSISSPHLICPDPAGFVHLEYSLSLQRNCLMPRIFSSFWCFLVSSKSQIGPRSDNMPILHYF